MGAFSNRLQGQLIVVSLASLTAGPTSLLSRRYDPAITVLQPYGHHFRAHEPRGGRHGNGVLRALRKGHLVIPMLEAEDAEDRLTLLLLQQVVDEAQGIGLVLGLQPPLSCHPLWDDKAGGGPVARARLNAPSLNELLQDLDHCLLPLSLHLEVAVALGPIFLLQGYCDITKRSPHRRALAGLAAQDGAIDLEDFLHLGLVFRVVRE